MKIITNIYLILSVIIFFSCSQKTSIENKIEGTWRRERSKIDFIFKGGVITVSGRSIIFASYEVFDKNTIKYRLDRTENKTEWLVKVTFQSLDRMIWQREVGGKLREWYKFDRIKEQ